MVEFKEVFREIADAIGWSAQDGFRIVGEEKTDKKGIALQGFKRTLYVRDSLGEKWTVHHDPTRGLYAGVHRSEQSGPYAGGRRRGRSR